MASLTRNPLATKPHTNLAPGFSLQNTLRKLATSVKRSRSPDLVESSKRARPTPEAVRTAAAAREELRRREAKEREHREQSKEERDRKRAEKEEEFRIKYTRAFPNWTFYFDIDDPSAELSALKDKLTKRILLLNARVDDFFSKDVTHLITLESEEFPGNKENSRSKGGHGGSLASPIKLKARETRTSELVKKALDFDIKVWSVEKLQSVLDRCIPVNRPSAVASTSTATPHPANTSMKERSLTRLLESERLHGTTERDPTQRRHDYVYFSKNSYFMLVEDLRQDLATIAAVEYPITRGRDGTERGSWPTLYCHPLARGPFYEYNEKEQRRRERLEQADRERDEEAAARKAQAREEEKRRRARLQARAQRNGDLRRAVSMQNLRREASNSPIEGPGEGFGEQEYDRDANESAAASGYLASGAYMAASGNSVSIASTTGTTSTAGLASRSIQLPPSLREKIENQVLTSRKLTTSIREKENCMGPPLSIPDRPHRTLRKSKSTTTVRLKKREEGAKPGYCECCRQKFDDFKKHTYSKRHRKFAEDDRNFANLDQVLSRVRRRTLEEMQEERAAWDDIGYEFEDVDAPSEPDDGMEEDSDDDVSTTPHARSRPGDEIRWNEWVEDDL